MQISQDCKSNVLSILFCFPAHLPTLLRYVTNSGQTNAVQRITNDDQIVDDPQTTLPALVYITENGSQLERTESSLLTYNQQNEGNHCVHNLATCAMAAVLGKLHYPRLRVALSVKPEDMRAARGGGR